MLHAAKRLYLDCLIHWHYGETYPATVRLPGAPGRLHVDAHDPRARKILIAGPLRGKTPRNQIFWRTACEVLRPSLMIDIGTNFGENLFCTSYPPATRVHGFEANPALLPYLKRSLQEHPQAEQVTLHSGLATDMPGESLTFYVDKQWSGGSTMAPPVDTTGRYEPVEVPRLVPDAEIACGPDDTLVFKIDVEGYEPVVVRGMLKLLQTVQSAVGLIEFDPLRLRLAGQDIPTYWATLRERFQVWQFTESLTCQRVDFDDVAQLGEKHTDLLVATNAHSAEALFDAWRTLKSRVAA